MKYLVYLDPASLIGKAYSADHDGGPEEPLPVLNCSALDDKGPFLLATRDLSSRKKSHQTLLIPYGAVAFVLVYSEKKKLPPRFALHHE